MSGVACLHCGAPFTINWTPGPEVMGVVCEACELSYYEDQAAAMNRWLDDGESTVIAFRCVKCGAATIGAENGSRLCDPCEDALHAEALEATR